MITYQPRDSHRFAKRRVFEQPANSNWQVLVMATSFLFFQQPMAANVSAVDSPPNILIITCDNLGYGDLKCYNPKSEIKTPYINELARQGIRLTSFYTASPTCTVSRASLLTGRIPQRHKLTQQLPGIDGNYGVGLNPKEILIPQLLQNAPMAYRTGCFGKWNIGFAKGSRPTERGFDEFVGHASGNMDYYTHNYNGKHDLYQGTKELDRRGEYCTELFADAAINFIKRQSNKKQPWFCYLPFNAPHFPNIKNKRKGELNVYQAPDWAFRLYGLNPNEPNPRTRYAAVVTALDRAIGKVLNTLAELKIDKNTFVFFMSDNGAFRLNRKGLDVGINFPLRHGGVTCWEGGLRVAAIARWPQQDSSGKVIDEMLWSPDLTVLCSKLSGAKLPDGIRRDGKDPMPVLFDGEKSPHRSLYFSYQKHSALRKGNWKIVRESPNQRWQLFDLARDKGESNNLADQMPAKLNELKQEFARWQKTF